MSAPAIFIVDDDEAELELTARIVEHAFPGVRLKSVSDSTLAQAECDADHYDCVILDYNMPLMNGLECARSIRGAHRYLPIVLSTGVGDEMLAASASASGVTDYIPKARITPQSLRRTIEHAIRETQQARIIDEQREELENFAYALAHDFKQPIRQIRTFAALVSDAMSEGRTEGVDRHLNFLSEAARRLGDLVDVMSQYTLLNQPPEIDDLDLNTVMVGVRASLLPYLEETGGQFTCEVAPTVRGNEALMSQVFQNLIVNGLKYNRGSHPLVHISFEAVGEQCLIRVRDNGIGIESAYLDEIFRPLARLHNSSEYAGSGLGLTLTRKSLAAQGGLIWCVSTPGAGSEFLIKVPLA